MHPDKSPPCKRLLLVEDDRLFATALSLGLKAAGHEVQLAGSAEEALLALAEQHFDLAILDEQLPGESGLSLTGRLRDQYATPFIFLTACGDSHCIERAVGEGSLAYLVKPVDVSQLLPMIATALARNAELARLRETRDQLQTALDQERDVSVAIGIVMARRDLDPPEAFELLRRAARASRRKLAEVARDLILSRGIALKTDTQVP